MSEKRHQISVRQKIGLFGNIHIFLILLFFPISSTILPTTQKTLAVAILMAGGWITQAPPITATSLIPIVAFPIVLH